MSALRFDGKVVIVTGAGAGLGRAYAIEFAKRGAKVVVNDLGGASNGEGSSASVADKVVQEIKSAGGVAVADYNSVVDGAKIVKTAVDTFGRVDVVINNAGILRDKTFAKMSEADWYLLQQVHLNGAYAVTKAAWPHMLKQKYGRIIMVTSSVGLYGNIGQSHYSAVKAGVVGLANSLALEGVKSNVLTNTIAPIAGSRLTESVMSKELVDALKPEYVAPLVLYLCHEASSNNGAIFEVGAGWISRVRWQRTQGVMFPLNEKFTAEAVAQKIGQVSDFNNATYPTTSRDAFGPIMENLNGAGGAGSAPAATAAEPQKTGGKKAKSGGADVDVAKAMAADFPETKYSYTEKEVVLYNLGIGAASDPLDRSELNFCYEGAENFSVIPTFGVIPPSSSLGHVTAIPGMSFNPMMLLHGEQYLEVRSPIPTSGTLTSKAKIAGVYDKGSGALVHLDVRTVNEKNEDVLFNRYSLFIRGQGGFGGEKGPKEVEPTYDPPAGVPPAVVHRERTQENQAALYRLSGDYNPLHVDPEMAKMGNFDRPILHGLCTFGYGARAVLKHFAQNDAKRFHSIRARFVKSVYPGETLITEMWPTDGGNTIIFRVRVAERGDLVLANAAIKLHPLSGASPAAVSTAAPAAAPVAAAPSPAPAPKKASSSASFAIEPVFNELRSRASADLVAKVKASFRFDITKDKDTRYWLLDLKTGNGSLTEGDANAKADCIIAMKDDDCVKLFAGQLNAQQAFMKGQIKIKGNMMLAQKLQLLQSAKAKL